MTLYGSKLSLRTVNGQIMGEGIAHNKGRAMNIAAEAALEQEENWGVILAED